MRKYSVEEMAIVKAVEKTFKPVLEEVNAQAKEHMLALNEDFAAKKIGVSVKGKEVGSLTLCYGKEKPQISPVPSDDRDKAYSWLDSHGYLIEQPRKGWEDLVEIKGGTCFDKETGEILDFINIGKTADYVRFNGCDLADVRDALGFDAKAITNLLTETVY